MAIKSFDEMNRRIRWDHRLLEEAERVEGEGGDEKVAGVRASDGIRSAVRNSARSSAKENDSRTGKEKVDNAREDTARHHWGRAEDASETEPVPLKGACLRQERGLHDLAGPESLAAEQ